MRKSAWLGVIIIAVGVLFFLRQMPIGQEILHRDWVWPMIWIVIGLFGTSNAPRRHWPWWSIFCVTFGVLFLLRNLDVLPTLQNVGSDTMFWALVIIFVGLTMLFPRQSLYKHAWKMGNWNPKVGGPANHVSADKGSSWQHLVGETVVGNQPWTLPHNGSVFTGLGESRVNLVTAHFEEGEYTLDVSGWIGSIRILVPRDLAVCANADLRIGEVTVFGDKHSGFGRSVVFEDPQFNTATTRLRLSSHLNIGEIDIVRV